MAKKAGLGRGLGALIPENKTIKSSEEKSTSNLNENKDNKFKVSLNLIKANEKQPRKNFDNEKIGTLADSIKEHGIIQPLLLKKEKENYIIIAGERRWRAAKSLGLKEVPAMIVESIDDKKVLELSLIENIQREDLNPIEEALAYERLIKDFKLTQEEVSLRIGKSRTAIANCLRLLNLDERVKEYVVDGVITEGHGRALLSIENKDLQYEVAQKVIDESLSVRELERLIKQLKAEPKQKKINSMAPYFMDIERKLRDHFGTKVLLNAVNEEKGKIQIEYYSQEELERILEILNVDE